MKFEKLDKKYLAERRKFSAENGAQDLWSVIDHWPLYVGISNLGRFMAIADLLRSTFDVPGHVAEFGSWKGANLLFMTKLLKIYDPFGNKVVHCFESFEGLNTFTPQDGQSRNTEQGTYKGELEELLQLMALYELDDDIEIHKGDIATTLPLALEDEGLTFSFAYCDTDLYEPSHIILESLHPRLAKGGLFVFDEWNYSKWPGEGLAVRKFMEKHGDSYQMEHVSNARQPSIALRKIRF